MSFQPSLKGVKRSAQEASPAASGRGTPDRLSRTTPPPPSAPAAVPRPAVAHFRSLYFQIQVRACQFPATGFVDQDRCARAGASSKRTLRKVHSPRRPLRCIVARPTGPAPRSAPPHVLSRAFNDRLRASRMRLLGRVCVPGRRHGPRINLLRHIDPPFEPALSSNLSYRFAVLASPAARSRESRLRNKHLPVLTQAN